MVATLPDHLRLTARTFTRWRLAAGSVLVFGVLLFLAQYLYVLPLQQYRASLFDVQQMEQDSSRLQDLLRRERAGDVSVTSEVQALHNRTVRRMSAIARQGAGINSAELPYFLEEVGPFLLVSMALTALVAIAASLWGYLLASAADDTKTLLGSFRHSLFAFTGAGVLLFLGSFLWIPALALVMVRLLPPSDGMSLALVCVLFAGYLLTLLFLPRMIVSPFLTLQGVPPVESIRMSMDVADGQWGKILGSLLAAAAGAFLAYWALSSLAAPIVRFAPAILFIDCLLKAGLLLALSVFTFHLSRTVTEHSTLLETAPDAAFPEVPQMLA